MVLRSEQPFDVQGIPSPVSQTRKQKWAVQLGEEELGVTPGSPPLGSALPSKNWPADQEPGGVNYTLVTERLLPCFPLWQPAGLGRHCARGHQMTQIADVDVPCLGSHVQRAL